MKQTKKGFTLVELLVVIAILAVLATVSIIGYVSFINKAQLSVDQQTTKQMNIVLEAESILEAPETVDQVRNYLEGAGFNTTNGLVPTMEGYTFYWYKTYNVIVLVNEADGSVYTPAEDKEMVEAFQADFANNKKDIYNLNQSKNSDPNRLWYADAPTATVPGYELQISVDENGNEVYAESNIWTVGPIETEFSKEYCENGWLFSFYPTDAMYTQYLDQREKYGNWIADFAIIVNDDFAGNTVGILGQYGIEGFVFPWLPIQTDMDIAKGTTILLMEDVIKTTLGFDMAITYNMLVEICAPDEDGNRKGFNCGAYNLSEENLGKSITVELRLYEADADGNKTGCYVVCNSIALTFNRVAQNTPN